MHLNPYCNDLICISHSVSGLMLPRLCVEITLLSICLRFSFVCCNMSSFDWGDDVQVPTTFVGVIARCFRQQLLSAQKVTSGYCNL